jgi:gamma-glutamyl:cysteine ligase YbdK (ATP-grasp superfamily)
VDAAGSLSRRADELLARGSELAARQGHDPGCLAEECSRNMVEVKTRPAATLRELGEEYRANLDLALRAARELGLRLYPLATYPLPVAPDFRDEPRYTLQARTLGPERFLPAGRCVGVHLHLELPPGTLDPETVVARGAPAAARRELLTLYNLATALDPAIVAITRSSPFYEGRRPGLAARTAFYRGSPLFGWEGVYSELPEVGALAPYARRVEELVKSQETGHRAWLRAMRRAGLGSAEAPGLTESILETCWRPVRLNHNGTVELRSPDGNYPEPVLAVAELIRRAASRVREEGLSVEPLEGLRTFEASGERLLVPDFEYLGRELFYEAVVRGAQSPAVAAYLDSVVAFAGSPDSPNGTYRTTEDEVLRDFPHSTGKLTRDAALRLVRAACDRLEEQVRRPVKDPGRIPDA